MNVGEAAGILGAMLETDDVRYPPAVRETHINQAMSNLSRELDSWTDKAISEVALGNTDAEYMELNELIPGNADLIFEHITGAWMNLTTNNLLRLSEMTYEAMLDKYGDSTGTPEAFALVKDRLYFRPMIETGGDSILTRFFWSGSPRVFATSETPDWLTLAPYGVIYRAGEVASVWLLEDERGLVFKALRDQEMDNVDLTTGMRGDGSSEIMEEP